MTVQKKQSRSRHKIIGLSIIIITVGALLTPLAIAYFSGNLSSSTPVASDADKQVSCLNQAHDDYIVNWEAADKDGDGKLSYNDGSTNITISYYDAAIACYRNHKTSDSIEAVADFQAKRQQEVDKYTAWLEASKQPAYIPANNYRSSMSCTSRASGSSVYTDCY